MEGCLILLAQVRMERGVGILTPKPGGWVTNKYGAPGVQLLLTSMFRAA